MPEQPDDDPLVPPMKVLRKRLNGVYSAEGFTGTTRRYVLIVVMLVGLASLPTLAAITAGSSQLAEERPPVTDVPFIPPASSGPVRVTPSPSPTAGIQGQGQKKKALPYGQSTASAPSGSSAPSDPAGPGHMSGPGHSSAPSDGSPSRIPRNADKSPVARGTDSPSPPVTRPSQPVPAPTKPVPAPTKPVPAPTKPVPAPSKPVPAPSKPVSPRDPSGDDGDSDENDGGSVHRPWCEDRRTSKAPSARKSHRAPDTDTNTDTRTDRRTSVTERPRNLRPSRQLDRSHNSPRIWSATGHHNAAPTGHNAAPAGHRADHGYRAEDARAAALHRSEHPGRHHSRAAGRSTNSR